LLVLGLTVLKAQESINATGGNASGRAETVAYSGVQVVYNTNQAQTAQYPQGVQQSFEISVLTGLKEDKKHKPFG
jgi:hypothetical protein